MSGLTKKSKKSLEMSFKMGHCKFHKKCKNFRLDSVTCTMNDGMYYEDRPAGCYRKREAEEKK